MTKNTCPNYNSCRLVNAPEFVYGKLNREEYIATYCVVDEQKWKSCKRFLAKQNMGFCPDFVLPDTRLTIEEIIDKFDEAELDK